MKLLLSKIHIALLLNIIIVFIIIVLIAISVQALAKSITDSVFLSDSDSLVIQKENNTLENNIPVDTANISDKNIIKLYNINKNIGSILKYEQKLSKLDMLSINYSSLNEIITSKTFAYSLGTGVAGNSNAFSFLGATPFSNKLFLAGYSMNNLLYGTANFNAFSPEFVGNMEILYGSTAAIHVGASGLAINIPPPVYNTSKPYTAIWYNQGDNKHIGFDGIFTQNFLPNWNITAGFRSLFSDGTYTNSNIKSWNARIAVRNNISDFSSIMFIYNFTNYYSGDFGGIDFNSSNSNVPNLTSTNFSSLSSRQYRNDVILDYAYNSLDSMTQIIASLYFTNEENNIFWDKKDILLIELDSTGVSTSASRQLGLSSSLNYKITKNININTGAKIGYSWLQQSILAPKLNSPSYYLFTSLSHKLNSITYDIGGRYENIMRKNIFSFGGKISLDISKNTVSFVDLSSSETTPLCIFNYENEKHFLGILSYNKKSEVTYDLNLFYRRIKNPILLNFEANKIQTFAPILNNISQKNIFGVAVDLYFNITQELLLSSKLQSSYDKYISKYPITYAMVTCAYTYIKNINKITAGIELAAHINNYPLYYNPLFKAYSQSDLTKEFNFNGITVFISAKLGNAFIRATLYNAIGTNYSQMAYYPFQPREFSLSLNWLLL